MSTPPAPTDADLLPCPFCGKEAGRWGVGVGADVDGREFGVMCSGCGASSSLTCESESAAIAAWNRRAPSAGKSEPGPEYDAGPDGQGNHPFSGRAR